MAAAGGGVLRSGEAVGAEACPSAAQAGVRAAAVRGRRDAASAAGHGGPPRNGIRLPGGVCSPAPPLPCGRSGDREPRNDAHPHRPLYGLSLFPLSDALRDAGVDVAVLANNHCCDGGAAGVHTTVAELRRCGILHTGVFTDSLDRAANNPLWLEHCGVRFALLNYTYGTNGIPVPEGVRVNLIDTVRIWPRRARDRRTASRSASTGGTNTNGRRMPNSGGWRAFCAATART